MKFRTILIIPLLIIVAAIVCVFVFFPAADDREPHITPQIHFCTFCDWYEISAASCTAPGKLERKCAECGVTERESTPSLPHLLSDWSRLDNVYAKSCTLCERVVAVMDALPETADGVKYTLNNDYRSYVISGITKVPEDGVVVIPNEVNGLKVTILAAGAFENVRGITAVILPDTLESIGKNAFFGSSLQSVLIPDGVRVIGEAAFSECDGLTSLVLPNSLETVSPMLCQASKKLSEVYLPASVRDIGANAFENCTSLKTVNLCEGVATVGVNAFSFCKALEEIRLPESLTGISEGIFHYCERLVRVVLPSRLTSLPQYAFGGCFSLETITIPDGVTSLGLGCFGQCRALRAIELPEGLVALGDSAFVGCTSLRAIVIPEGINHIGLWVFSNCRALELIDLPASISYIKVNAFASVGDNLHTVRVSPDNKYFSTDGKTLFSSQGRIALGSADGIISEDASIILSYAFYGRQALTEIRIPKSVTRIDHAAFGECTSVTSITYEGTVAEWENVIHGEGWFTGSDVKVVHCSDGDAEIEFPDRGGLSPFD